MGNTSLNGTVRQMAVLQGSLYCLYPNNAPIVREIPQNYSKFALLDCPNIGNLMINDPVLGVHTFSR